MTRRMSFATLVCLGLLLPGVITVSPWAISPVQAQAVPAEVRQGFTLLGRGWVNDAITTFRRAIQRYPNSIEAKLGLAIAYRRAGQDAAALQTYEQVLAQDPTNPLALKSVGILGAYRSEWQARGIAALTTLLNQNPNDLEARAQRALLYGYQNRFAESLADYQIALQGNPPPEIVLGAAQIYTYSGNSQQGLALFNRYQQATGKSVRGNATIAYARALRDTGNAAQAVQVLESQLTNKLDEASIQLRSELSQAYLANGQPAQALAVLDPLRDRPNARLPLARALNELGRQTNTAALSSEAARLYRQVVDQTIQPSPILLREAADVLSGQPQEREFALQIYRQLAQSQPNNVVLQVRRLALENQLGYLSKVELRQNLRSLLQTLPTEAGQQQAIAQALAAVDPDPEFLPLYQQLLQAGVNEPFLNFRVAQILIEQNQLTAARNALAAYTTTPQGRKDLAPQLLAAEIERREGNLEASARRYQAIITAKPADSDVLTAALQGLAGIRLAQGRPAEALTLYDQLVARNPQDLQTQLGRTSIAYQAKRISQPEAEAVLNAWLRSRPPSDTPAELFSLVGVLPPNPQLESLYIALAEADPSYTPVQLRLVQVLAERNPAAARARVARLIARDRATGNRTNVNTYLLQGQLAQAVGDLTLAGEAYQAALNQQPDNTDALSALGGIRFRQRRFDVATQLYNQALALNPDDFGTQRAMVELTVVQDYPLAALSRLEQLQVERGSTDADLSQRRQKLEEDFLQRRGFQPPWERY